MFEEVYTVERMVPRVIEDPDGRYDVAGAASMIMSLPQRLATRTDVIVALRGQGEWWRERDAIRLWQGACCARQLLIAGSYSHEVTWTTPTLEQYQKEPYGLKKMQGVYLHSHAHHTAEQADHVIAHVIKHRLASMTLCASPYHLVRAFMTTLASMDRSGMAWIPIIPLPTEVSPAMVIPEENRTTWELLPGEMERIPTYQPMGDVVSYERLRQYLSWLWAQPLLQQ